MNDFKSMLKHLRNRDGLSQEELAKKLGVAKSTVSMYEVGKREPNFEMLEAIADTFNVDINFLLGKANDEPSYYTNPETAKLAQEVFDDSNLRVLMDASKDLSPEDLKLAIDMVKRLKGDND